MDDKDVKILKLLKEDSKLTTRKLSKAALLPITTVHNRIKKLEKIGVIKRYTVELDHKLLGKDILIYILINTGHIPNKKYNLATIGQEIKRLKGVEEVILATGEADLMVKVRLSSISELNEFLIKSLRGVEGVETTKTMVVLEVI